MDISLKFGIVLVCIALTGCIHEKPLPASQSTEFNVTIQWVESESEIPVDARNYRGDVDGYSVWFDRGGTRHCIIYAYKPYNVDDFNNLNSLGHELLHCTDGHYHGRTRDKNGIEYKEGVLNRHG